MTWGSVADWVAAVGASGALFWAVNSEVRRQRRERDLPAHRVSAWTEWDVKGTAEPRPFAVYVHNADESAAYSVVVEVRRNTSDEPPFRIIMGIVAGGQTSDYVLRNEWEQHFPPDGGKPVVELYFTTSDERRWHRSHSGTLSPLTAYPFQVRQP